MTTRRTTARTATTIEERIAEATRTAIAATAATTATATPTTFGIELEMTGISRKTVSELVYNYLQSKEEIEIYCMDTFKIIDQQGRKWSVDYDAYYLQIIKDGYTQFGFDKSVLEKALKEAR